MAELAASLGIDLRGCKSKRVWTATGQAVDVQFAEVSLTLTDDRRNELSWLATVGFAKNLKHSALVGIRGCLEYFDATFFGAERRLEIVPNAAFPGISTNAQ
ncbi:MAG: hypothetical protein EXS05_16040 [Planctomycetaceae bacterium]|nr:hypothetical protein [Planctomycetaceae bacterium]